MLGLLSRAGLALKPLLCFSVEREGRKRLSRHGSVEIFDGSYNLTVPNRLSRHTSTTKLEEIHTDHIKIAGQLEDNDLEQNLGNERRSNIKTFEKDKDKVVTVDEPIRASNNAATVEKKEHRKENHVHEQQQSSTSVHQTSSASSAQQSSSFQQSAVQQTGEQSSYQQTRSSVQQTRSNVQQTAEQLQQSGERSQQRSRHASASNATIVSGNRFNISSGLRRGADEVTGQQTEVGAALRGLDTALQKIAAQQKKEEKKEYGNKVTSRQTSRRWGGFLCV